MAIALVASVAAAAVAPDETTATTAAIDTTGASLIVISVSYYNSEPTITVADSKGNTWTALTQTTGGGLNRQQLYYCYLPTVGSGHTFSISEANDTYPAIGVLAFSGTGDYGGEEGGGQIGGTTITLPTVTPSADGAVVVTGVTGGGETSIEPWSIDEGYTKELEMPAVGSVTWGIAMAYLIQTTATATDPTWTSSAATNKAARIAVFDAPAAPGGGARATTFILE